jgi:hypothetical protein
MSAKREEVESANGDKKYIRRDEKGRFTSYQVDEGRSLSQDRKRDAKNSTTSGQGDKGDGRKKS